MSQNEGEVNLTELMGQVKPFSTAKYFASLPLPNTLHLTIPESDLKPRLIIVGDVHGCYHELLELLEKCNYIPENTQVILVGDLVNKGPHSAEVVQFARKNNFLCIRGNHDHDALVYALKIHPLHSMKPNYLSYLDNLDSDDIEWLKELPYTITLPSRGIGFVHAGLIPNLPLEEQSRKNMVIMRNIVDENGVMVGSEKPDVGVPWINLYNGNPIQHVYFGHDAKRGLQQSDYATGLDTGCIYGKCLSAMILPERQLVQVKAHRTYVEVNDKE